MVETSQSFLASVNLKLSMSDLVCLATKPHSRHSLHLFMIVFFAPSVCHRSKMEDADWRPAVLEGLLFSSHSPVLGKSLSAAVAQKMSLFESHVAPPTSGPAPSIHRTSPLHFATVGYRTHGAEAPHKPTRLSVAVQPFEVLLWWPAVGVLTGLANALSVGAGHENQRAAQDKIKVESFNKMHDLINLNSFKKVHQSCLSAYIHTVHTLFNLQ